MHLKRVIPCLDVDNGRVVKGTNFVGLRDAGDPVELAERYDAEGADELVFLNITASHEQRETIVQLARRTADNVFIPFTIGGGIRSVEDAQAVLDAGADKVSVQPASDTLPSRASTETTIRSPCATSIASRNSGSRIAAVPSTTRSAPAARTASTAAVSRRPPPTWIGHSTAAAIRRTASRFCGWPAFAPSRSTTWMYSAPSSAQRRAASTESAS